MRRKIARRVCLVIAVVLALFGIAVIAQQLLPSVQLLPSLQLPAWTAGPAFLVMFGLYILASHLSPPTASTASSTVNPIWKQRVVIGEPEVPRMLGGVVAPVLAGFSLATVALLSTTEATKAPPFADWAILAFVVTVILLASAMQFAAQAVRYSTGPADRLAFMPEALANVANLNLLRNAQSRDRHLEDTFRGRFRITFNLGLATFVVGLGLVIWPRETVSTQIVIAEVLVVAWLIIETGWAFLPSRNWLVQRVSPNYDSLTASAFEGPTALEQKDSPWKVIEKSP